MLRIYLRLFFTKLENFLLFFKNYKQIYEILMKSVIYRKKVLKVLEINKIKLSKKLEIIDLKQSHPTSKSINYVR